jgi:DNA polymerase elongation subunit (family B)
MVHLPKGNYNEASLDETLLSEYCKRDVEIVYRAVRGLIAELEENDLGSLRYTAASVAWSVYRHKFYPAPVITHHKPVPVSLERHAYVGGMVKVCKLYAPPKREILRYDVNSMYPFVMRENFYPAELVEILPGLDVDRLAAYLDNACVIADVDVDTDEPIYPFRSAKRVWYPVGEFRSILCTGSLLHALRAGHLRRVRMAAVYERRDLFSEYVDHFYARKVKAKKAHDTAGERFAKLCLNSLYGKFGQKGTEVTFIGDAPLDVFRSEETWNPSTGEQWRMLEAGGQRLKIERGGETLSSFPAVAAHVTDYARLYLWSLMQLAGLDNVYYTDTDSLMVNGRGALRLTPRVSTYDLGYLKPQGESWGVKIFAKKDYLFDMDRKCKSAKAPESIRPDGTYTEIHGLGIYAAAEIEAIEGAHWRRVTKYYNPYVDGCKVDPWYNVHPLRLPRDLGRLTKKTYTWPMIGGKK